MEFEKAKKIAAKLLSYKMYTCKEIFTKLIQKGITEEVAETVVAEFCRAGLLDDEEYAKMYIHDAVCVNMKGVFRIKQELIQKGIAHSIIEKAIKECETDPMAKLREYVELRFADKVFSDWKDVEKAKAHLVRRGFGIYDINKCFDELDIKVSTMGEDEE